MSKKFLLNGEDIDASLEMTLAIELFLNENYRFRRNLLNGKVEFTVLPAGAADSDSAVSSADKNVSWRPFTMVALNSMIRKAKKEQICKKGSPKTEIQEFVYSDEVPDYDPIAEYLENLPEWDGQNHIAKLFGRIPGLTSEMQGFLATWLLSAVAHWLQKVL